ncbi:hypothetical protein [Cronobacter sakazakii]|uniref:hypothetical protein n=1 Tax=Cronobacter sakazakii TaxID=28141 RepID=UPI000AAAAD59|nr:hypothetical protein [Cronobacter sakazakii]
MADGDVVAYRVCRDYLTLGWESGPLYFSGSFVLVKHYIQPGEKETSGLHFYTLYMHLAPYSAYESANNVHWITHDTLSGYSEADWLIMDLSRSDQKPASAGTVKKGIPVTWDPSDQSLTSTHGGRTYGLATLNADSGKLKAESRTKGMNAPTYGNYGAVTRQQVRKYMDPETHQENSELYQYLDISAPSGVSRNELAKLLAGKGSLSGKKDIFINAAYKYSLNEVYLVSHALLGTDNGMHGFANGIKSYNGRPIYNMYGIGVFPNNTKNGITVAYRNG